MHALPELDKNALLRERSREFTSRPLEDNADYYSVIKTYTSIAWMNPNATRSLLSIAHYHWVFNHSAMVNLAKCNCDIFLNNALKQFEKLGKTFKQTILPNLIGAALESGGVETVRVLANYSGAIGDYSYKEGKQDIPLLCKALIGKNRYYIEVFLNSLHGSFIDFLVANTSQADNNFTALCATLAELFYQQHRKNPPLLHQEQMSPADTIQYFFNRLNEINLSYIPMLMTKLIALRPNFLEDPKAETSYYDNASHCLLLFLKEKPFSLTDIIPRLLEKGDLGLLFRLYEKGHLNAEHQKQFAVLAAQRFEERCLLALIERDSINVNANYADRTLLDIIFEQNNAPSPSSFAALTGGQPSSSKFLACIRLLLTHGAKPNTSRPLQPLDYAIQREDLNLITLLLRSGAKVAPRHLTGSSEPVRSILLLAKELQETKADLELAIQSLGGDDKFQALKLSTSSAQSLFFSSLPQDAAAAASSSPSEEKKTHEKFDMPSVEQSPARARQASQ